VFPAIWMLGSTVENQSFADGADPGGILPMSLSAAFTEDTATAHCPYTEITSVTGIRRCGLSNKMGKTTASHGIQSTRPTLCGFFCIRKKRA
jgi:hypothetical protein